MEATGDSTMLEAAARAFIGALGLTDASEAAGATRQAVTEDEPTPKRGAACWEIIARVEGDESDFLPDQRLTTDQLRQMAETFDVERRRVAVKSGHVDGTQGEPGHWSYNAPVAEIEGLSFDGLNLWARISPMLDGSRDLYREQVERGYTERSIEYDVGSNETAGRAQLLGLALLSMGEQPGISNMPRLDRARAEDLARQAGISPRRRYRVRSYRAALQRAEEAQEDIPMALSEEALEQIREATSAAVTAGLEPIQETITALDGRVRALEEMEVEEEEEETEEVEAASDDEDEEEQDDERSRRYERACQLRDGAVRSGRRPAQVDLVVNAVFGGSRSSDPITDEQLRILEGTLRAIPVVGAGGSLREEVRTSDDKSVMLPANAFRTVGLGRDADPAKRQQLAEAMAAATDEKGNTSFAALRSEIYRQAGELMPARGNFGGRLVP